MLTRRHHTVRYDVVHVHNVPDFLVFAAWYPKVTGARLILDIHDIVPELFVNKFKTNGSSRYVRFLKMVEAASATFADHVIVSNDLWHAKLKGRSVRKETSSVFVNHVDPGIFYRHSRTRNDDKFVILFPGTFQWHQGLDIGIRAFARVREHVPNAEFHLYGGGGGGDAKSSLQSLAKELGLNGSVKFFSEIRLDQVAQVIADADLGVVPKRADSFGNEAYSTKIMEFMAAGTPVIVSDTKVDRFYFGESVVRFFRSEDFDDLARQMIEVLRDGELARSLVAQGAEYAACNSWGKRKADYLALVDSLCN